MILAYLDPIAVELPIFQASTFLCPRLFMNFHDRLTFFIVSFQNRLWEFHIPTECSVDKVLRKRYFCRVIVFQKVLIEHEFQNFLHNFWLFRTHWLWIWWCQVSILLESKFLWNYPHPNWGHIFNFQIEKNRPKQTQIGQPKADLY